MTTNPTPDPASVERTAKALFEFKYRSWKIATDTDKAYYRDMARAAITAAGTVTAGAAKAGGAAHCNREALGQMVRAVWVSWAREQSNPKPSWLVEWDGLAEPDKEVDRRIGEALFSLGERIGRNTQPEPARVGGEAAIELREAAEDFLSGSSCSSWVNKDLDEWDRRRTRLREAIAAFDATPPAERVSPEAVRYEMSYLLDCGTSQRWSEWAGIPREQFDWHIANQRNKIRVRALGVIEPVAEKDEG